MPPKDASVKYDVEPDLPIGSRIVPTITTDNRAVFDRQFKLYYNRLSIHLDYSDGTLAPSKTLSLNALRDIADKVATAEDDYRSGKPALHIHVMASDPRTVLDDIIALHPRLVYLHAEARISVDELKDAMDRLWNAAYCGIGLALTQATDPASERVKTILTSTRVHSVLIFGGELGYQGGTADLAQLKKIPIIRSYRPDVIFAWDGGANINNVDQIRDAGVQTINVGSAVSRASDPLTELTLLDEMAAEDDHEIPLCNNCD